jgi:predicted DNA-binding transcriptional regulator YafY
MQPIGGKKALSICILKILKDHSDCDHPLTSKEIIGRLKQDYGIDAARNTVSRNISILCEMGYDISTYEDNGKGAYLAGREFDDTELRVLIDSVMISKYIPAGDAKKLADKIASLSNVRFRGRIRNVTALPEGRHQRNREFFFSLSIIDEAIAEHKQIAFHYNRIDINAQLIPVRESKDTVHPYAMVCSNGQYYLLGSFGEYDDLRHYRIDRITDIELLNKPSRPVTEITGCEKGLDVEKYASEHNFMYGGRAERVVLKMNARCLGDVFDAFGYGIDVRETERDLVEVRLTAAAEGIRFFALQFGPNCEVLEPPHLRAAVKADIAGMAQKYGV